MLAPPRQSRRAAAPADRLQRDAEVAASPRPGPAAGGRASPAAPALAVRTVTIRLRPAWERLGADQVGSPCGLRRRPEHRLRDRRTRRAASDRARECTSCEVHTDLAKRRRMARHLRACEAWFDRSASGGYRVENRCEGQTHSRCRAPAWRSWRSSALLAIASHAPRGLRRRPAARGKSTKPPGAEPAATPVRPPGDVDLVRLPLRGRQHRRGSSPAPSAPGSAPSTSRRATAAAPGASSPRSLVEALHAGGLDVCAWQFVYGDSPVAEARVGAAAVRRGADCLVIDAEGHYEGKYAAADRYIRALRARIGEAFPLSLAGFPYVDYHPSFPYSVFFGPGGATYNQPQMYWKAIGTSVRAVYEHTYLFNRLWGAPDLPARADLRRRRAQGDPALPPLRRELRRPAAELVGLAGDEHRGLERRSAPTIAGPVFGYRPIDRPPGAEARQPRRPRRLGPGAPARRGRGRLPVTGIFGRLTRAAVRDFQDARRPARRRRDRHARPGRPCSATNRCARSGRAAGRSAAAAAPRPAARSRRSRPLSASLPAKAYEIDPGPRP